MKRWRILRIGPTEICLHPAVLLYLGYAVITGHLPFTVMAFASIILHEAAHSLTSAWLGQRPTSIEITPLGAVMRLEDEGKLSSWRRMLMVLAGPGMTLLLCWAALMLVVHGIIPSHVGQMFFLSNLSILLLNLLPVLPLDGGRLLILLLESILSRASAAKVIKIISVLTGTGLIILNIIYSWRNGGWNFSLAFAGCCIIYSASMYTVTHAMSELRYFLDRKILLERKGEVRTVWYTALHTVPVWQLVRMLPPGKMAVFVCSEAGTGTMLGCLHESALIQIYLERPGISMKEAITVAKNRFDFAKSDTN